MKKRKPVKNGIAKDLRTPKYRMKVKPDKKKSKLQRHLENLYDQLYKELCG